ncbi:predicted protein [Histoplasma mississippiense (nom. inval.)]|uniref:predicted protein n=1 Tax=Ajellomyces capsulatus (strain NAm1 / WU24) TaxID=2059318 RepID=UPI000157CC70|nr:predicted protein [Histoplasma mississippiense (nom. inval.)]EDN10320.1 predicted protein [Histoplasma mississippiense (nom. inval.)]
MPSCKQHRWVLMRFGNDGIRTKAKANRTGLHRCWSAPNFWFLKLKVSRGCVETSHIKQDLVQEIESRAVATQQQINIVRSQITGKQRELRLLELTSNEISQLPKETNVYEGVGKMFVANPITNVNKRLSAEKGELKTAISNLEKKLHYLETTHKNSRQHMDQIFKTGGKA